MNFVGKYIQNLNLILNDNNNKLKNNKKKVLRQSIKTKKIAQIIILILI